ncbi:MAG TPA: GGDEF domain-containing protein [Roseateles sp.]
MGLLLAAGLPALAATPRWLVQLDHAVLDDPEQVLKSAKAALAGSTIEADKAQAETRLLAASLEVERQDVAQAALPVARARLQAGGPVEAWCLAAMMEPVALWRLGDRAAAWASMDAALARTQAPEAQWCRARLDFQRGQLLMNEGRQGEAAPLLQQAVDRFVSWGENDIAANVSSQLAWLAARAGPQASLDDAIARSRAALALPAEPVPRHLASGIHHDLGGMLMDVGKLDEAREHLKAALSLAQGMNDEVVPAFIGRQLARLALKERRPAEALQQALDAGRVFRKYGVDDMTVQAATIAADALLQLNRPAEALKALKDAEALRIKAPFPENDVAHWRIALSAHIQLGQLQAAEAAAAAFVGAVSHREELTRQKALAEANAQFDVERREAENRRLLDQQAANASRQFWLSLSLLLACALLGLLSWHAARQRHERKRLRMLAEVDELTGLPNRRALQESLRQDLLRAKVRNEPFCLAICDIDHFKRVNDRFGHDVGDAALRCFAQAGRTALRSGDTFGRYGGEEFLILMRGTTVAAAPAFERLAGLLRQTPVPGMPEEERLSFSMGVAAWRPELSEAALIQAADQALYRAKGAGRARFEIAP